MRQLPDDLTQNTKHILFGGLWVENATMDLIRSKYTDMEILIAVERVILYPRRKDDVTTLFAALRKSESWEDLRNPTISRLMSEEKLYCLEVFEAYQRSLEIQEDQGPPSKPKTSPLKINYGTYQRIA